MINLAMPVNLFYELKKCEGISYADPLKLKSGGMGLVNVLLYHSCI